jgi:hypothetical protein
MARHAADVIDLDEARRRRDEQKRKSAQEALCMVVYYPVWFWVPLWPAV